MSQLRNRPRNARLAFFGLGLCTFALTPTEVGYQDIASLLARQPGVAERWQSRVYSANRIQLATYSFGRPIGTYAPQTVTYPPNEHRSIRNLRKRSILRRCRNMNRFDRSPAVRKPRPIPSQFRSKPPARRIRFR